MTPGTRGVVVRYAAPVLLILFSVLAVWTHVPRTVQVSPLDEYVYLDYLAKIPTQGVVTHGEELGQYAREALICNGARGIFPPSAEQCELARAGELPDSTYPLGGRTSADIYTPLYFAVTYVLAQPFLLLGVQDLGDAASCVGAIWLAAGALFLFAALRRFRAPPLLAFGITTLVIASPPVYWATIYVSTDAPTLLIGAVLLWLTARILSGSSGRIAFLAVSVAGVLFKVQNILGVGLCAVLLLVWSIRTSIVERGADGRGLPAAIGRGLIGRDALTAIAAPVAGVAAQVGWLVIREAIATGPTVDQATGQPLTAGALLEETFKFLTRSSLDPSGIGASSPPLVVVGWVLSWLAIAGVVGVSMVGRNDLPDAWLARTALVVSCLAGPALVLGVVLVEGYYFPLPSRYGLVMLPAFLACTAMLIGRRRWVHVALTALGVLLLIGTLILP